MREIYQWTDWFKGLAGKIADGGETYLVERAKQIAWNDDGTKPPLLRYGDENIDPFSFVYSLAQRSQGAGSRNRIYPGIKEAFNMEGLPPVELDDAFVFPTPPYNALVLFHNKGQGNPQLLWNLFRDAVQGLDSVDARDFGGALDIGNVGKVKLTQTLFLVNSSQFIPCDGKMALFVELPTGEFNWAKYREWLQKVRNLFPGCEPYEINLFAYLRSSGHLPVHVGRCFQVSSNVYADNTDYWHDDFGPNNWVYTGGPGSGVQYPVHKPQQGDIVLVRFGREQGRGIGVVYRNDYGKEWSEDARLHVLWVNKQSTKLAGKTPIQGFSFAGADTKNAFQKTEVYAPTFRLLGRLKGRVPDVASSGEPPVVAQHPRNQILYGPPGTGKTYHTVARALVIIDGENVREREGDDVERFRQFKRSDRVAMVTFHQNFAYEDFIEGIRPVLDEEADGQIGYELRDGIFKQIAKAAKANEEKRFVLIIDEINRGNIAKIFGELITLIEPSRRLGRDDETEVTLPYSNESFGVPDNLYIIGTMNTADRSIQLLDTALRRRFDFVEMMPEPEHERISEDVDGVNCREMLKAMNERIAALLDRERQIGHTYLMGVDTIEGLSGVFRNKIFPLLQE